MSAPGHPIDLRLLADDLTGALDSAAAFAGSVPVYLDRAPEPPPSGVVAVATPTRDLEASQLPAALAGVLAWFAAGGLAFKKVDSLLRGNTFAECAYLARAGGFDGAVFAPAYPGQRRVTFAGRQWSASDGRSPASRTALGESIVEAFAALGLVADVSARVDAAPSPSSRAAPRIWVPDVTSDADLLHLAQYADAQRGSLPGRWLWCGSAGLAHALAARLGIATASGDAGSPPAAAAVAERPAAAGPVLMLGASHHPVVRRQWARLREAWPSIVRVREGDAQQLAAACEALARPYEHAALELSPLRTLTPDEAAELLRAQLVELVRRIRKPATLLVVGGDSLLAACRATGVASLQTLPASRPGWGCARLVGGAWDGVRCHSRSGAFGDERDLETMLRSTQRSG